MQTLEKGDVDLVSGFSNLGVASMLTGRKSWPGNKGRISKCRVHKQRSGKQRVRGVERQEVTESW